MNTTAGVKKRQDIKKYRDNVFSLFHFLLFK